MPTYPHLSFSGNPDPYPHISPKPPSEFSLFVQSLSFKMVFRCMVELMVTHRPRKPASVTARRTHSPAAASLTTEEILQELRRLRAASKDMYRQLVKRAHEELAAEEAAC